jgi:hypothetical protein
MKIILYVFCAMCVQQNDTWGVVYSLSNTKRGRCLHRLTLGKMLGKMSLWVNVRHLKFFEECGEDLTGPDDGGVFQLISFITDDHDPRYEVQKILWHRTLRVGVKCWCGGRGMMSLITSGFVVRCWRRMYLCWFLHA